MRVLILGGGGMLGHKMWQEFQPKFDTWITTRQSYHTYAKYEIFDKRKYVSNVDAFNFDVIAATIATVKPDVVVNCIGIIKQLDIAKNPIISLKINSLFPHQLAQLCQVGGIRLIHFSTDCVFSGNKGMYIESDISDANDLYGRTKYMGEIDYPNCLTIRSSIIGRELGSQYGLIEWFLHNQDSSINGFTQAIYTGFPTIHMAQIVANILENHPDLSGIYHVSSNPISKYDLLCMVRASYGLYKEIEPNNVIRIDRSLDSTRFREKTGFEPKSWSIMIEEMVADSTPYEYWSSL